MTSPNNEPPRESPSEAVILELLKVKLDDRQKLQGDYFRVGSLLLVVLGAILKFSVDKSTAPEFRLVFPLTGILLTAGVMLAIWFGELARRTLQREIADLDKMLHNPLPSSAAPRLKYALICATYFSIVILSLNGGSNF